MLGQSPRATARDDPGFLHLATVAGSGRAQQEAIEIRQEAVPIEVDDLFRLRFLQDAQLARDRNSAVFVVSHVDGEDERVGLWVASFDSDQIHPLSDGSCRDVHPRWSPDGRTIAFRSDRTGTSQLYLLDLQTERIRAVTDLGQGVRGGPEWSPDGRKLAFTAAQGGEPRGSEDPYRVTRPIFRFDNVGYLDHTAQDLWVVDVETCAVQCLTADGCHNTSPSWSPDGRELLCLTWFCPDSYVYLPHLRVIALNGEVRELAGVEWGAVSACWHPSGERVVFVGAPRRRPFAAKNDLWIVNRRGGIPECRTDGLALGVGGLLQVDMPISSLGWFSRVLVQPDGAAAYGEVQDGGKVEIYRIGLEGPPSWQPVVSGDRGCIPYDLSSEDLLYGVTTIDSPPDLFVSRTDGASEKRLTRLNEALLDQRILARVEHLRFLGNDEVPLEGWLLTPPLSVPPYPTVLSIHGGRHAAWGQAFSFDHQMLVGAGYAVLLVNYRGSRGYGDAFSLAAVASWGYHDFQDLMAGLDHVVGRSLADPERLGVCGASAGGTLTAWIVSHTSRFKAAVAESLIANWTSAYGTSDIGPWFHEREFGGPLHETLELALRNSVISYAHRCRTPTLVVQHEEDYRCPSDQAEQFYTILKYCGCVVEMLRLPASSHGGSSIGPPRVRRAQNEALLDWMNRYVLEDGTREAQPDR